MLPCFDTRRWQLARLSFSAAHLDGRVYTHDGCLIADAVDRDRRSQNAPDRRPIETQRELLRRYAVNAITECGLSHTAKDGQAAIQSPKIASIEIVDPDSVRGLVTDHRRCGRHRNHVRSCILGLEYLIDC